MIVNTQKIFYIYLIEIYFSKHMLERQPSSFHGVNDFWFVVFNPYPKVNIFRVCDDVTLSKPT